MNTDTPAAGGAAPGQPAAAAPGAAAPASDAASTVAPTGVAGAEPAAAGAPADASGPSPAAATAPVDAAGPAAAGAPINTSAAAPAAEAASGAAPAAATAPEAAAAALPGTPVDQAAAMAGDHSILGLILQAGPVVQGVMLALALASVVCWAIMIEKGILLGGLKREIRRLAAAGGAEATHGEGLAARIQRAAAREWSEGREHGESRGDYRERIERAMRETLTSALRRAQSGTAFLATTGAVGPFVGLFGTVWGIMGSFQGIAASRDTSLAVVAPGIAEALLATAIGLFAAIPAVIGYNRIARRMAGLRAEGLAAISAIGARLSARPPRGGQVRAAE